MLKFSAHHCSSVVDVISFISVCGIYLALKSSTSLPVHSAEFAKDDPNYMAPYQAPTLSPGVMSILSHITPVIFIIGLCLLRALQSEGFNTGLKTKVPAQRLRKFKITPAVMAGFIYTGYFFFGACLMAIFNKVVAHAVGRLSPNFLAVCKPDYTEGSLAFTRNICTGNEEDILQASLSFPSEYAAHLSFGFFFNVALTYCIPQLRKVPFTRLVCLLILVTLPILGGITRYTEGFNHVTDVIVGIAVGFASAAFIALYSLRLFGTLGCTEGHVTHTENQADVNIQWRNMGAVTPTTPVDDEERGPKSS